MPPKPKSILKNAPPTTNPAVVVSSADAPSSSTHQQQPAKKPLPTPEEARRIAIFHATQLELRKRAEATVLASIEALIDTPHTDEDEGLGSRSGTPSLPGADPDRDNTHDPADVALVKVHLRLLRPADLDEVVAERNAVGKCGYPLCGRARRRLGLRASMKIVDGGRRAVPVGVLERFCSEGCARRAVWVRVQLSDEPVWAREGFGVGEVRGVEVILYEERGTDAVGKGAWGERVEEVRRELAEMGVSGKGVVKGEIVEGKVEGKVSVPVMGQEIGEEVATRKTLDMADKPVVGSGAKKGGEEKEEKEEKAEKADGKEERKEQAEAAKTDPEQPHEGFELPPDVEEMIREYQKSRGFI